LVIRWFRSIATTSTPSDPTGSGRGFGTERDPARLVFFSGAVFAVAVTLLVLEIRPPQDTRHLLHGLAALWPSYLAYAITFLLIGQVWANHHVMFDHIRSVDRMVLFPQHPAGRPAPRPRHGRDRRVHPLLLAADPWRDRQRQAPAPRPRSRVTPRGHRGASRLLTPASSRNLRAVERTSPNSTARAVRLRRTVEASPVREGQP
jgi:hypothetical protein